MNTEKLDQMSKKICWQIVNVLIIFHLKCRIRVSFRAEKHTFNYNFDNQNVFSWKINKTANINVIIIIFLYVWQNEIHPTNYHHHLRCYPYNLTKISSVTSTWHRSDIMISIKPYIVIRVPHDYQSSMAFSHHPLGPAPSQLD